MYIIHIIYIYIYIYIWPAPRGRLPGGLRGPRSGPMHIWSYTTKSCCRFTKHISYIMLYTSLYEITIYDYSN